VKEKLDFRPLTVRLSSEEGEAIEQLAAAEERDVAWIHRRLIREALAARGRLAAPSSVQPPGFPSEPVTPKASGARGGRAGR